MNREPVTINGKTWIYDPKTKTHRPADQVADGGDSGQAADLELPASCEPVAAGEGPAFDSRVSIEVVSYRSRLADSDGVSAKAAIDGLVAAGILRDDSAKEVSEVTYRQVKVGSIEEEETHLIITRAE